MPDEPSAGKYDLKSGLRFGAKPHHADLPLRQEGDIALGQNVEWLSAPGITLQGALIPGAEHYFSGHPVYYMASSLKQPSATRRPSSEEDAILRPGSVPEW